MFERTLDNLVKGIRSHKSDAGTYVSNEIQCIKGELKGSDPFVKAEAVRKLTYLNTIGYDISWAAFSIVEVMSMPRFGHKRIGYLAASQTFRVNTEAVLLTTNQLKKELISPNDYEIGLAAGCLANIATRDLSRDVLGDVVALLQHQRPYVRKKALLVLYKLFEQYPQALRLCFEKIRERLEDTDKGVVSCAVSVVCELADRNPKNYLALAPQLFTILTKSSNNWMLIKVVKLFGSLVEEEPRLARKLLEPLSVIIKRTSAKSLLYECIHTITLALPHTKKPDGTDSRVVPSLVKLCSDHLREFVEDQDQNLKYLGLVGFANMMNSHPRTVAGHYNLIIDCLEDDDITIRTRSLDLLAGMVTKRTLEGLVQRLLKHVSVSEGSYRQDLIGSIIFMCSRDKFAFLSDFKWYMGVLLDLSTMIGTEREHLLSDQLINVALRVKSIREFAIGSMIDILLCPDVLTNNRMKEGPLTAVVWIVGEYASLISKVIGRKSDLQNFSSSTNGVWCGLFSTFLSPEVTDCTPHLQSTFVFSAFKVFISACSPTSGASDKEISNMLDNLYMRLLRFCTSPYLEVSERASNIMQLFLSYGIVFEANQEQQPPPINDKDVTLDDESCVDKKLLPVEDLVMMEKGKDSSTMANLLDVDVLPPVALGTTHDINDNHILLPNNEDGSAAAALYSPRLFDDQGVTASRAAEGHLRALISVPLNPVNSKAQSKVPPPEGISLEDAIKPELLAELLQQDGEGATTHTRDLSAVRFSIRDGSYSPYELAGGQIKGMSTSPVNKDTFNTTTLKGKMSDVVDGDGGDYAEVSGGAPYESNNNTTVQTTRDEDCSTSAFYLGSKEEVKVKEQDDVPSLHSSSLDKKISSKWDELENDEAYAGGLMRSKKLRRKRVRKHSKKQVSGGEEPTVHEIHHNRRRYARRIENDELSKIDITTPLREDERMPELKHREIVQEQNEAVVEGNRNAEEGTRSVSWKDKRKHSRKRRTKDGVSKIGSKENAKHQKGSKQGDLLDFSAFASPKDSAGHQAMETVTSESLQADLSELLGKSSLDTGELQQLKPAAAGISVVPQAPVLQPYHNREKERDVISTSPSATKKKKETSSRKSKGRHHNKNSRKHSSRNKDVAAAAAMKKNTEEYLLL